MHSEVTTGPVEIAAKLRYKVRRWLSVEPAISVKVKRLECF